MILGQKLKKIGRCHGAAEYSTYTVSSCSNYHVNCSAKCELGIIRDDADMVWSRRVIVHSGYKM